MGLDANLMIANYVSAGIDLYHLRRCGVGQELVTGQLMLLLQCATQDLLHATGHDGQTSNEYPKEVALNLHICYSAAREM